MKSKVEVKNKPNSVSNREINCNCNDYNFRKILQLVIIVAFTKAFAKVIRNCNNYIYIGNRMDLSAIWE